MPLMLSLGLPAGDARAGSHEAREAGAAAVDAARLSGNHHHLSWALWEYGLARWYGGDTGAARVALEESRVLADETGRNVLWESEPGWALATIMADEGDFAREPGDDAALVRRARAAAGRARRALHRLGHPHRHDDRARPARRGRGLRRSGSRATSSGRWARCWPSARGRRCRSRAGTPARRRGRRARRARSARDAGLQLEGRRAQVLLGRALAAGGDRTGAIRELRDAELALDAGGAHAHRDEARRELRKLGHRVDQARRRGAPADAARGARGAVGARARGGRAGRGRPHEPRDRRGALPVGQDRRDAPAQRLQQARRRLAGRGRRHVRPQLGRALSSASAAWSRPSGRHRLRWPRGNFPRRITVARDLGDRVRRG